MSVSCNIAIVAALLLTALAAVTSAAVPTVSVGPDGKLIYIADERGNVIPDFSNCGYGGGGIRLPEAAAIAAKVTLHPVENAGDDAPRIQEAIDSVGKLPLDASGFRGAVLLARGTYRIMTAVQVSRSGVVLRGEGEAAADGTTLVAVGTLHRAIINLGGAGKVGDDDGERPPPDRAAARTAAGKARRINQAHVPVGARALTLDDAAGLKPGDEVTIHRPSTAEWVHDLGMDQIPPRKDGGKVVQWSAGSKELFFERVITAVDGNRVTFNAPIMNAIDAHYGGGTVEPSRARPRTQHIAVENLRGVSDFHGDVDEAHSWTFIQCTGVENGWVRNVTAEHFAFSLVTLGGNTKEFTVQDCHCLDPISQITGGRRYSFCMSGCQLCLIQRCSARNGRHDHVMGSTVPGPNVFLKCRADREHADSGPHQRWSVGVLYDGLRLPDGQLNIQNRGSAGSGHGWAGAYQVCWNCEAMTMTVSSPPTAMNWAIGCIAKSRKGDGVWESFGAHIAPESLYLAQLSERLGPAAAASVAKP